MKFLHIADLHIGRRLNNIPMLADQRYILDEIIAMAAECDAILIAGDLYNRAQPGSEALRLGGEFLGKLNELNKPVFIIAGNHDGAELVDYCGSILGKSGIHVSGNYDGELERHVLKDEFGEIHVYLLPFIKPILVRAALKDKEETSVESYEDAVRIVLERTELDESARNVLVAHQYVSGAAMCDSEERMIGGLDEIPVSLFDKFDYVALGHLHSPQKLAGGKVRYSGSPLKYSLSEEKQKKGALIVDMGDKGDLNVEIRPLASPRDVRTVQGLLAEIAAPEKFSEDFVSAIVTDEIPPADPLGALRIVYPNLISLRIQNSRTNLEMNPAEIAEAEQKDVLEHFMDFYTRQNNQVPPDEWHIEIMREIIEQVKERNYEAD